MVGSDHTIRGLRAIGSEFLHTQLALPTAISLKAKIVMSEQTLRRFGTTCMCCDCTLDGILMVFQLSSSEMTVGQIVHTILAWKPPSDQFHCAWRCMCVCLFFTNFSWSQNCGSRELVGHAASTPT